MPVRKSIRLFDKDFNFMAEIDDYESLQFTRRFFSVGEFELRIHADKKHVDLIDKGILIVLGNQFHKVGIIKSRSISLDGEQWVFQGPTLKGITGQRITVPPVGLAYDVYKGSAESAMKHYINANVINPVDTRRKITQVSTIATSNRGSQVNWQSRFKVLSEELQGIAETTEMGWEIFFDPVAKTWLFDIVQGMDRSINQTINPPVIFSPDFRNVKSQEYTDSDLNYRNVGYVAGDGEGEDRRVVELGTATGIDRLETFIDARDIQETNADDTPIPEAEIVANLTDRGNQKLITEYTNQSTFESQLLVPEMATNNMAYEEDWDLGDIVTVQNRKWKVTLDSRITETKETYEPGGFQLEAVFGKNQPTFISLIKQQFKQVEAEVKK
ncbi:siphovirus ReqiPepy6 Gp37-like family protein [Peribacillus frigoritolerans]|uniref:siphovirus ReqiPepy6 Gp37-like family protein n=2 Tax=Bacteria TaxID=2 RepID=UPI0021CDFCD1|nr:siphovirus ReqiPepy6 Gp37-like family protein [Peribacillus frigoritolerans]MCU6603843.1 siphovirus ReqiPepy6 Gp37-like family protein [Peribacillus frigoritolerans]